MLVTLLLTQIFPIAIPAAITIGLIVRRIGGEDDGLPWDHDALQGHQYKMTLDLYKLEEQLAQLRQLRESIHSFSWGAPLENDEKVVYESLPVYYDDASVRYEDIDRHTQGDYYS